MINSVIGTHLRKTVAAKLGGVLTLSLLGVLLIWPASGWANDTSAFGPTQYTREAGAPQNFSETFGHCGTATCELIVSNGTADDKAGLASASIMLNGEEIVAPRDFNKVVTEIRRPVMLAAQNELQVQLQSGPQSTLTVEVQCAASPVSLAIDGRGVDLSDSTLFSAVRIENSGMAAAENTQVTSLILTDGTRTVPAMLPYPLGTIAAADRAVLNAEFIDSFVPLGNHTLQVEGTYEAAGATYCFALEADLLIPPAAPGSAPLNLAENVPAQVVSGAPFEARPPQYSDAVNPPYWIVPEGPLVPAIPTETTTGMAMAPGVLTQPVVGLSAITANAAPVVFFATNAGGINGGDEANTSTTTEPSGASDGNGVVFVTGNWFASFSTDGGSSFTPLNPTEVFPADTVGFCCDQIVQYVPEIDRFIWLLQGSTSATQLGGYRLAAASPDALETSGATAWTYWNLTPAVFGQPAGTGFDYPDMSVGNDFLYLGWDAGFGCPSGCTQGFQIARIPLDQIAAAGTINIGYTDPAHGTMAWGAHIAQNTADELFWAGHNNNSEMRVFTLAEDSNSYFWRDVGISSWATGGLSSTTPDGLDWMNKLSGFPSNSVHGLTRNGNEMWLAWSAGTDSNFPRPHIEMVTLDNSDFDVIRQVQVWNEDFAFGYPALATNLCTREIGLSLEFGGNGRYENHAVGFWGDFLVYQTTASDVGTNRYGDYVAIRREPPNAQNFGSLFAAFGYGLNATDSGTQANVHYVSFGRPASSCPIIE